jgi:hypothetical protein
MAAMEGLDHLLHWRLKAGSHPFPGRDGGTCINEAALVAAGFDYKPIRVAEEMPDCFSRPICRFAMLLNDHACDEDRQRLLPFVTRLACADTPEVENARAAYINRTMRRDYVHFPFDKGLEVLEGALAIGRQADPFPAEDVRSRMDMIRERATTPTSVPDTPLLAKIKGWFASKTELEPAD